MPRTIFLVDFDKSGHHLMYADSVRGWLESSRDSVHLVFVDPQRIRELYQQGKLLSRIVFWSFLKDLLQPLPHDLIFFLYWDDVKPFWLPESSRAFLLPNAIAGIWMNTWGFRTPGRIHVGARKLAAYPFLKERHLSLLILDEGVLPHLQKHSRARLGFLPDFTDEKPPKTTAVVGELKRYRGGRKLCLMIGAVSGTKNPRLFLDLVKETRNSDWVFAVIGEVQVDWLITEGADYPNLRVWNGRIADDGEYNALLAQADLLWGVYHRWQGSSNLITKAGQMGIPVVVAPGYLAEERVRAFGLGYVVNDESVKDVLAALENWNWSPPSDKGREMFCDEFSAERAKKAVLELVRTEQKVGRPSLWGWLTLLIYRVGQRVVDDLKGWLRKPGTFVR